MFECKCSKQQAAPELEELSDEQLGVVAGGAGTIDINVIIEDSGVPSGLGPYTPGSDKPGAPGGSDSKHSHGDIFSY